MEIKHHENGDSEFTFPATMTVGASDNGSSSVVIGSGAIGLRLSIYQEDEDTFRVYDGIKHISDPMKSKADCIIWIVKELKGR